jgi:hypothetical protein
MRPVHGVALDPIFAGFSRGVRLNLVGSELAVGTAGRGVGWISRFLLKKVVAYSGLFATVPHPEKKRVAIFGRWHDKIKNCE